MSYRLRSCLRGLLAPTALLIAAAATPACATTEPVPTDEGHFTSADAQLLELAFEAEVVGPAVESDAERKKQITAQLFYLSGELDKVHGGHGRFGYVEIDELETELLEDGLVRMRYSARLPVAWPRWREVPPTYELVMPRNVEESALTRFNETYAGTCGKAKYGAENLWYDFEPIATGCEMAADDVVRATATVAPHPDQTTDRRPEFERFWEDGAFHVVVVHGTDSASSMDPSDIGVREYLEFKDAMRERFPEAEESEGESSWQIYDDWTLSTTVPAFGGGEGELVVHTLLTSSLKHIGAGFDERFAELSASADFVAYAGHSGLSKNIRAFANKMAVVPEHYQVVFLDGCSTFAYLDSTLTDRRIEVHGVEADPYGTKHLDVILNAQPVPWWSGADSLEKLVVALSSTEIQGYLSIVDSLSSAGVPLVAGEEDNPTIDE